ncbi:MAG: sulfotransferase [Candidatus Aminicenantes bacterium]|nr:MAG: sulfotransferase [Candidatus Aminicenantes bacterium]
MSKPASHKILVQKPIFIIASGRSGTTLLYRLLCGHPDTAWFSGLTDIFPRFPQISILSRLYNGKINRFLGPSPEAINIYKFCGVDDSSLKSKGSSLTERDVNKHSKLMLYKTVAQHLKWMGKSRFISKNTANGMRIRYLKKIFPDALFVHIIRNGYGVVNSLLNVKWWPDLGLWWLGKTPKQWEEKGGNPAELCTLHWKRQVEEILQNKEYIRQDQYFECRYEHVVDKPLSSLKEILEFCQLRWSDDFEKHIKCLPISSLSLDKWQDELDEISKKTIKEIAGDLIDYFGY